jgi:hypothetical protein
MADLLSRPHTDHRAALGAGTQALVARILDGFTHLFKIFANTFDGIAPGKTEGSEKKQEKDGTLNIDFHPSDLPH